MPDILEDKSGIIIAQNSLFNQSDEVSTDDSHGARRWSHETVSTSWGEVAVKHYSGKRLAILFLGPGLGSSADRLQMGRLADRHELIEMECAAPPRPDAGPGSRDMDAPAALANLAVEVLERSGVDSGIAVDGSPGGRIGQELMAVFPGLVGLVVVGSPALASPARDKEALVSSPSADFVTSEGGTAVLHMPVFDELALQRFAEAMESRVAELNLRPQLWYGG